MNPTNQNQDLQTKAIRLNRLLAQYGTCSRRKADEFILAGRVRVDGKVCRELGTQVDPHRQKIHVDGSLLQKPPERIYLALNKPRGYVTTNDDPQGRKIVLDLLPQKYKKAGLFPVGRLDTDSEGLLLMTNDGDWSQILLHPRHQVWKEYLVTLDQPLSHQKMQTLRLGVEIEGQKTLPSRVRPLPGKEGFRYVISIREGRNRQIRKMCQALGVNVRHLRRVSIGPIVLGRLTVGQFRELSRSELEAVSGLSEAKPKISGRRKM